MEGDDEALLYNLDFSSRGIKINNDEFNPADIVDTIFRMTCSRAQEALYYI